MQILGKILGGESRVKIMRLFLLNKSKIFGSKEISKRSRVDTAIVGRELKLLQSINFIKKRSSGFSWNDAFRYKREMEDLLIMADTPDKEVILSSFKKTGKLKLLLLSGIFIKNKDSRVDILIIGDGIKKGKVEEAVRKLEAEIGTELSYAVFETKEFIYRLNMFDKLVRDILDFPHEVVLETKELSTQALKKP
ncbi:hypothetical protein A2737_01240 [Candidatus Nomurabacteria bacterium RIFCSPHIGHO2_01_FULL_41_71]|nr:MAG: hypothetical protein A2737_01240 [Candidatus Nomurabacteria bacterium RIFCSPHIGHO2_01_FULL_41_71]